LNVGKNEPIHDCLVRLQQLASECLEKLFLVDHFPSNVEARTPGQVRKDSEDDSSIPFEKRMGMRKVAKNFTGVRAKIGRVLSEI
jgi:hypothetical protein